MKKLTTEQYIDKCKIIHNNVYDYIKTIYTHSLSPVTITCTIHGDFKQIASKHLSGNGCKICAREKSIFQLKIAQSNNTKKRTKTLETFINESNIVHNSFFDYSKVEYKNIHVPVCIICPIHGEFFQRPVKHISQKTSCPTCSIKRIALQKTQTSKLLFENKANNIHNNFYNYTNSKYINAHEYITIECPIHGSFQQTPNSHLNGNGCPTCGHVGIYTEARFKKYPELKNQLGLLYVILLNNQHETFYKIGITTRPLEERIKEISTKTSYKCSKVIIEKHLSLYEAFCYEQQLLSCYKDNKYIPKETFSGYTECVKP